MDRQKVQQHQLDFDLAGQHLLHEQGPLLLHFVRRHFPVVFLQGLIDRRQQVAGQNGLVADEGDLLGGVVTMRTRCGGSGVRALSWLKPARIARRPISSPTSARRSTDSRS